MTCYINWGWHLFVDQFKWPRRGHWTGAHLQSSVKQKQTEVFLRSSLWLGHSVLNFYWREKISHVVRWRKLWNAVDLLISHCHLSQINCIINHHVGVKLGDTEEYFHSCLSCGSTFPESLSPDTYSTAAVLYPSQYVLFKLKLIPNSSLNPLQYHDNSAQWLSG